LIILAQRNLRAKFLHYLAHMKAGDGSGCGRCLAEDAPVSISDVNNDAAFEPHLEAAIEAGFRAVRAFPVRDASGKMIAVLSTYFDAPQSFAGDDQSRMSVLTSTLGSNLESHLATAVRP
jgi:hypothetical protein